MPAIAVVANHIPRYNVGSLTRPGGNGGVFNPPSDTPTATPSRGWLLARMKFSFDKRECLRPSDTHSHGCAG